MDILILDGHTNQALMLTRALGGKGHLITTGVSETYDNIAGASRYCTDTIIYPDPSNMEKFIEWLDFFLTARHFDCLIPPYEQTTYAISKYKQQISSLVGLYVPDIEILDLALDKWKTILIAKKLGIPVPNSRILKDHEIINIQKICHEFTLPLFMKSKRSNYFNGKGFCQSQFLRIDTYSDLIKNYPIFHQNIPHPIIQEYFPGYQLNVSTICQHGEPKVFFTHQGIRDAGLTASATCVRISVVPAHDLLEQTFALLREMKWHGPAEVEYRVDSRTGVPYLIEVNGRVWQGIGFGMQCGVDFDEHILKLCKDQPVTSKNKYRVGEKSRWLLGDIIHLGATILNSEERNIKIAILVKTKAILTFIIDFFRIKNYDESIMDMRPLFHQLRKLFGDVKTLLFRKMQQ